MSYIDGMFDMGGRLWDCSDGWLGEVVRHCVG